MCLEGGGDFWKFILNIFMVGKCLILENTPLEVLMKKFLILENTQWEVLMKKRLILENIRFEILVKNF